MPQNQLTFAELFALIKQKISANEKNSYTAELAQGGAEKITRKVGEEAVEVVIAAFLNEKKQNAETRSDLIGEVADLYFHSLVLLATQGIELDEILQELTKRNEQRKHK